MLTFLKNLTLSLLMRSNLLFQNILAIHIFLFPYMYVHYMYAMKSLK